VEAAAAAAVGAVVRRLSRRLALALGGGLGRAWGALDRRHLEVAAHNLRLAFPEWDEARVARTARGVYEHFGRVLLDILWMEGRPVAELLEHSDAEGVEHLQAARAAGRGVICPTGHFGNWEFQGVAAGPLVGPFSVIARPLDNPALDRRLVAFRTSAGTRVIYKQKALAQVLKTLREGGVVAILIDQNVQETDGVFVRFFGRPACTTTVAAALALKTGCAIVPVRCPMGRDGRYRMIFGPPVEWNGSGRRDEDIVALTQRLTSMIEGWVRGAPEQWLWLHRRWKTQPSPSLETSSAPGLEGSRVPSASVPDQTPRSVPSDLPDPSLGSVPADPDPPRAGGSAPSRASKDRG
jgi:KDO2-lipid IV(A) lauroyltransferase